MNEEVSKETSEEVSEEEESAPLGRGGRRLAGLRVLHALVDKRVEHVVVLRASERERASAAARAATPRRQQAA